MKLSIEAVRASAFMGLFLSSDSTGGALSPSLLKNHRRWLI